MPGGGIIDQGKHRREGSWFSLTRSEHDRVLAGVAGGLGERLEMDPVVVRLAFVALAFAGGFGVVLYLFGWLLSSEPEGDEGTPEGGASKAPVLPRSAMRQTMATGLVVAGLLLLLRQAGLWFGDSLVWPVALAAFGSAVIWARGEGPGRQRLARLAERLPRNPLRAMFTGEVSRARIALGAVLIAAGMAAFLAANDALSAARGVGVAVVVTVSGIGLLLGPWMWRLARQLSEERRERIRSEERAEVAAHLHDSVLQTLALIQRASGSEEMASLARGQERELRAWLYGRSAPSSNGTEMLSAAVDEAAGRVERRHHVTVGSVVVGDCPMDERVRAMVDAAREAMQNAAKHSGAAAVSVYAEAGPDAVNIYVRDEGSGFVIDGLPTDRRGIAESIVGRMERHGGTATIATAPGEGTEVHLRMPRHQASTGAKEPR